MGDVHFRNQHAIGSYIVDFCAPRRKLIIELDGSQHLGQQDHDAERTKYLELRGYQVLRFWNHEFMNHIDDVLNVIWNALHGGWRRVKPRSTPALLPAALLPGGC